eukprot:UN20284
MEMVKFDLISFWGLSLRTIVSTGTAPKVQQERRVFQLQGNWRGTAILVGRTFQRKRSHLRSVLYLLCLLALWRKLLPRQ